MLSISWRPVAGRTRTHVLGATIAAGAAFGVWAPAASADTTECAGTLPPAVYKIIVVPKGSACELSPGTTVTNGVHVAKGAAGLSTEDVEIGTNVIAAGASVLRLSETRVAGDVHLAGINDNTVSINDNTVSIADSTIGGTLSINDNTINDNTINDNTVSIFNSRIGGTVSINDNTISILGSSLGSNTFLNNADDASVRGSSIEGSLTVLRAGTFSINDNTIEQNLRVADSGIGTISGNQVGHRFSCEGNAAALGGGNVAEKDDCALMQEEPEIPG